MLDDSIAQKLRVTQADIIKKTGGGISFSRVINRVLDGTTKL